MSQFSLQDMTPDNLAKLVKDGIGSKLEDLIYEELRSQAEATARKVAKEIAERLSAQVHSYKNASDFTTRIDLEFNLIDPNNATPAGTVIDIRDGYPVVAWGNTRLAVGTKIFA